LAFTEDAVNISGTGVRIAFKNQTTHQNASTTGLLLALNTSVFEEGITLAST
jgi:hypothetical protein